MRDNLLDSEYKYHGNSITQRFHICVKKQNKTKQRIFTRLKELYYP